MNDTSENIKNRMRQMIMSRTATDRLRMAGSMFDSGKKLVKAGLLNEKGTLTEAQLRTHIFLKLYGEYFTQAEIKRIVTTIPNM